MLILVNSRGTTVPWSTNGGDQAPDHGELTISHEFPCEARMCTGTGPPNVISWLLMKHFLTIVSYISNSISLIVLYTYRY